MKEETIKIALKSSLATTEESLRVSLDESKKRKELLTSQFLHTKDILGNIRTSLQTSIARSRQLSPEAAGKFLEQEITNLDKLISIQLQQTTDEIKKLIGVIETFDICLGQMSKIESSFETELARAKEIQDLQAAGELEKRRKPGTRPVKLSDIRKYADKNIIPESTDAADVSEDS